MKKLALLTLLQLANALPSHRRIPDILAQIREQQHQQDHAHGELTLSKDDDSASASSTFKITKYDDIDELYFDQLLDHLSKDDASSSSASIFKQRYFYSSRYVAKPTSPSTAEAAVAKQPHLINNSQQQRKTLAFLCVGGEGPALSKPVLLDSVHCSGDMIALAQKLYEEMNVDVHLFALEHRYYGESFPPQKQSAKTNLRGADEEDSEEDDEGMEPFEVDYTYLSSRQAVEDIANFATSPAIQQKHLNLSSDDAGNIQWITFGGSYPGMLSAWSHLLHPSSIFASVSNSAPIEARLDFEQYHEHVGKALQEKDVGGSKECFDIVKEGHEQIVSILDGKDTLSQNEGKEEGDNDGLDQLAELFNVCDGGEALRKSKRNQNSFVGDGVIRIPAQGNDPSCVGELCNIRGLCNTIVIEKNMNPKQSSMEILASISKLQSKGSCKEADWNAYIDYFKTPVKYNANDRSWFYQTCNEFGFYQTCNEDSTCPYGKGYHTIEQDLEFCQVIFGIDADKVRTNVESTLTYYGGWDLTPNTGGDQAGPSPKLGEDDSLVYGQKRIISVTGTVDPWTELALTGDKANADHPSVSVPGASHHFWTHKVKDSDDVHVVQARNAINDAVIDWLGLRNEVISASFY